MNKVFVALISNKAVVLILLLLFSIHEVVKASPAKKSPGKNDDDTINDLSPLLKFLAEVRHFPPATPVFFPLKCKSQLARSLASIFFNN